MLEQQRENVALAEAIAELLRHGEPGHDCARLGCSTDDLVARIGDALIGVPIGWRAASPDGKAAGRARATIRVSLLGGFEITRDGVACELPEAGQRLVGLVASHGRAGLSWAAEQLAPGIEQAIALDRLNAALAGLRMAGLDVIESDGRVLSLAAGVTVDAQDAEGFRSRLERQGGGPVWSADHDRLLLELLPGWREAWAWVARDMFRELSRGALETEMRRLLDGGSRTAARTFAEKVLRVDPLRESTLRLLIEVHLAGGDDARARDCYLDFRRDLVAEVGLEPTPMAHALVAHLLDGEGSPGRSAG